MKFSNDNKVQVSDLVLVDFRSKFLTKDIENWRADSVVPAGESCARQVWYGTQQDFENFPSDQPNVNFKYGADAYELLLSLTSGFESKKICETHIRFQFFNGWRAFREKHPDIAPKYQSLIKQIKTDTSFINENIVSGMKTHRKEHAAIDLSYMKKNEDILIVGNLSASGDMSPLTKEMIKVCESRQQPYRDFLTVTHPCADALEKIKDDVALLKQNKITRLDVRFVPFEDVSRVLEMTDKVYVTMPMGNDPEMDQQIIDMWQGRSRKDNVLVSLLGNPKSQGQAIEPWLSLSGDDYVSSDAVSAEVYKRGGDNKLVQERAIRAFSVFSELRARGEHPRHDICAATSRELGLS